jgi:Xaa-Pro aminopeptidase
VSEHDDVNENSLGTARDEAGAGRAERLQAALAAAGLDGLVAASPENACWLSGAYNPVRRLIPERPAIVLWPSIGLPTLIAASIEDAFLRQCAEISDLRLYDGTIPAAVSKLSDLLREAGLSSGRLGVDLEGISAPLYRELCQQLSSSEIVDASTFLAELRAIKAEAEIELLRQVALATDRAEWTALDAFRPGWTERKLGIRLRQTLIDEGAETIAFLILGGGKRGVLAHAEPQDVVLAPGELLRFDLGGLFGGWFTDLAKTAAIGQPSARQRRVYRALRGVLDQHIQRLQPGALAGALYDAVADDFRRAGLPFRAPHVGHGIGLSVHEWPILHAGSEAALQADMVLCAEVICVDGGRERHHLEELVWVRENGPEVLSRSRPAPAEIPIIG